MFNHPSDGPLQRLLYVSRLSGCIRSTFEAEIEKVVAESELNNRRLDVTGVLISHDGVVRANVPESAPPLQGKKEVGAPATSVNLVIDDDAAQCLAEQAVGQADDQGGGECRATEKKGARVAA